MTPVVPIKPLEREPEPAEAPEIGGDAEGWALLDGLRRRMDDHAAQGRKTAAQVTHLAESIAALVEVQRRRTRGLNLNSFVAYVIFTLLCGAGAYAMYWSRAHELVAARDAAVGERDAAVRRADEAHAALAARDAAEDAADAAWQRFARGDRAGGAAAVAALAGAPLSKVTRAALEARVAEARPESADQALRSAIAAFKAGRFGEVAGPLEAALASEPAGPRAASMHYYAGVVAAKSGDLDRAIAHLQAAISGNVPEEDVHDQLAGALDRKGQYALARAEYDRFATAHPRSPLAAYALRRSATLARMPAVVGPTPVPPVAVPPVAAPIVPAGSAASRPPAPPAGSPPAAGSDQ